MTYKTKQEVLRAAADWMDVCVKSGIPPMHKYNKSLQKLDGNCTWSPSLYEFPLGILDGKEVWADSVIYYADMSIAGDKAVLMMLNKHNLALDGFSWEPPKPKTVMVEMLVDDAEHYSRFAVIDQREGRFQEACRKALEAMK